MTNKHERRARLYRLAVATFLAAAVLISHSAPALAQWNVTRVADQATTGINIGNEPPSIFGQEIAFFGNGSSKLFKVGPAGIPTTIFQTGGAVPGAAGSIFFQAFSPYSFSGQTFAFTATPTSPPPPPFQGGTFAQRSTGPLIPLAGLGSTLSHNAGFRVKIDGDDVAYGGTTAIRVLRAGMSHSPPPAPIADNTKQVPGASAGTNFSSFTAMDFDNGTVVFSGGGGSKVGIYYDRNDGTGIQKLVDNDTVAPGGSGTAKFSAFLTNAVTQDGRLVIDGNDVLFYAQVADGRTGLFICRNFGPPELIVDYDPSSPTFLSPAMERADRVVAISVSNGEVAFMADDAAGNVRAIFATNGGAIQRVIGTGAVLNGRTVDEPYGGNEMRSGDTIAFGVGFVENFLQLGIYRADRVANSGIIANGSFTNGLNNWTPSGSVSVVSGPAAQLTADGPIPGPAQLSQSINTPNGTFIVIFDYKFTTTAGSLELLINNNSITNIPAPPTLAGGFTRVELLVNNPIVMGLTGANFTIRLNPGSLSSVEMRNVLIPLFTLPPREVYVFAQTIASGQEIVQEMTAATAAIVQSSSPAGPNAVTQAFAAADLPFDGSTILGAFGGAVPAIFNPPAMSSRAKADGANRFQVIYTGQGVPPSGPVPINLALNISGSLDLEMNASNVGEAGVFAGAGLWSLFGGVNLFSGHVELNSAGVSSSSDFSAGSLVDDDASSAFFPTGRKVSVVATKSIDNMFYLPVGATVALSMRFDTGTVGDAIADFSHTMGGKLSSSIPGIQIVPVAAGPSVMTVDCSAVSLQAALGIASPGTTISVSGTCNENILVRNEKQRITIDGSGAGPGTRATIMGSGNAPVVNIRGKGILLQNFHIFGGSRGIYVNRGSNAVINNNLIQNSSSNGVVIAELAFAVLTNNTIQDNPGAGVFVSENATARIGFNADSDTVASANTIQNNGVGVVVSNNSSGRVIGNTIQNNTGVGVQILRDSHADIAGNTINNNADGIEVGENSLVQLGEDSGTNIYESANSGTNVGFGVKCLVGGTADGRIGSLTGGSGAKSFLDASCTDSLSP
jgi:hypothetical protein